MDGNASRSSPARPVRTTVVGRVHSTEVGVTEHVTFAPPPHKPGTFRPL